MRAGLCGQTKKNWRPQGGFTAARRALAFESHHLTRGTWPLSRRELCPAAARLPGQDRARLKTKRPPPGKGCGPYSLVATTQNKGSATPLS